MDDTMIGLQAALVPKVERDTANVNLIAPGAQTICAVIVTYHPDENIFQHLATIAGQASQTVIVDNGSSELCLTQLRQIANKLGVHLIVNRENKGIARALNQGAEWAAAAGYPWILTLDQDTTVDFNIIESLTAVFHRYPLPQQLAVIGSNYTDKVTGKSQTKLISTSDSPYTPSVTALTSGSLVSLRVFQAIGGFRDDFFIDGVDHEYCLRARSHGFQVALTSKPVMKHGIGHMTQHRVLWKKVGTSNHDAARQYFMSRNSFLLARQYIGTDRRWILGYMWAWIKSIVVICLFEEARSSKMKNIFRGCVDGMLGRTSTPRSQH
jgi:rhamnosyltransferase